MSNKTKRLNNYGLYDYTDKLEQAYQRQGTAFILLLWSDYIDSLAVHAKFKHQVSYSKAKLKQANEAYYEGYYERKK